MRIQCTALGLREKVAIRAHGGKKWRIFSAKLDTGTGWSRIGAGKAAKLGLLIGRRTIGSRFVIDPKKSYLTRPHP